MMSTAALLAGSPMVLAAYRDAESGNGWPSPRFLHIAVAH